MNKTQRKRLDHAINLMELAGEIIAEIRGEEQEKFDNLSEGLQATAANARLEDNACALEEIETNLEDCRGELESFVNE